jgi:hypothetical protein
MPPTYGSNAHATTETDEPIVLKSLFLMKGTSKRHVSVGSPYDRIVTSAVAASLKSLCSRDPTTNKSVTSDEDTTSVKAAARC